MLRKLNRYVALAALVAVASSVAPTSLAQMTVPSKKAQARGVFVDDFRRIDALRTFMIEGVSLNTPADAAATIVTIRGYCETSMPDARKVGRSFTTSTLECLRPPRPPAPGTWIRTIKAGATNGKQSLTFTAYYQYEATTSTRPTGMTIQDNEFVRMLKELKALVCDGVPDATQRHNLCPPNTDKSIRLAADGRNIVLGKTLGIRLEGDPFQIIVHIWETP